VAVRIQKPSLCPVPQSPEPRVEGRNRRDERHPPSQSEHPKGNRTLYIHKKRATKEAQVSWHMAARQPPAPQASTLAKAETEG